MEDRTLITTYKLQRDVVQNFNLKLNPNSFLEQAIKANLKLTMFGLIEDNLKEGPLCLHKLTTKSYDDPSELAIINELHLKTSKIDEDQEAVQLLQEFMLLASTHQRELPLEGYLFKVMRFLEKHANPIKSTQKEVIE